MEQRPGSDAKQDSDVQFIWENAFGIPIQLSAAPSTTGGELNTNQWGIFGLNIYFNLFGSIYSIPVTLTP